MRETVQPAVCSSQPRTSVQKEESNPIGFSVASARGGTGATTSCGGNRKKWTFKKISEGQRRLLATEFAGDAWQRLFTGGAYYKMRNRAWEATGSLITADGSEDEKIAPQGLTATDWPGPPAPGFAIPAEWVPQTVESGGPAGEPEGEEPEAESGTDEEPASSGDEEEEDSEE